MHGRQAACCGTALGLGVTSKGVSVIAGASLGSLPGLPSMLPMMDTSEVDHLLGLQRRLYGEVRPLPDPCSSPCVPAYSRHD